MGAVAKRRWRREHGRVTHPWIPEPGRWMQFDYGDGPVVEGRRTALFCAWLAWSRFRVVVALRDKTLPSVVMGAAGVWGRADVPLEDRLLHSTCAGDRQPPERP